MADDIFAERRHPHIVYACLDSANHLVPIDEKALTRSIV